MTENGLSVLRILFQEIWLLFTSWTIPGTNVTPAAWGVFCLFFFVVVRFVKRFFTGDSGGT